MRRGGRRSETWGMGRVYRPVVFGRQVLIWWLDYSVRGVRIRESSKTRDYNEARRMIPERKAVTEQVLSLRGVDLSPYSTLEPAQPQTPHPEWLTRKELARWFKCSERTVSRLGIPVLTLGYRTHRYRRADVEAWLTKRSGGGNP